MADRLIEATRIAKTISIELQAAPPDEVMQVFKSKLNDIPSEYRELVDHIVGASLVYGHKTGELDTGMNSVDKVLLGVGSLFLLVAVGLAVSVPIPTAFQLFVFRTFLALASGAFAAVIPGMLDISLGKVAKGSGALGVFLLVYMVNPAVLVLTP